MQRHASERLVSWRCSGNANQKAKNVISPLPGHTFKAIVLASTCSCEQLFVGGVVYGNAKGLHVTNRYMERVGSGGADKG